MRHGAKEFPHLTWLEEPWSSMAGSHLHTGVNPGFKALISVSFTFRGVTYSQEGKEILSWL